MLRYKKQYFCKRKKAHNNESSLFKYLKRAENPA